MRKFLDCLDGLYVLELPCWSCDDHLWRWSLHYDWVEEAMTGNPDRDSTGQVLDSLMALCNALRCSVSISLPPKSCLPSILTVAGGAVAALNAFVDSFPQLRQYANGTNVCDWNWNTTLNVSCSGGRVTGLYGPM